MMPALRHEMPAGLASQTMTAEERIESLLLVVACALTRQQPHKVAPWLNS